MAAGKQKDVVFRFAGIDGVSKIARGIGRNLSRNLGPGLSQLRNATRDLGRNLRGIAGPLGFISGAGVVAGLGKSLTTFANVGDEAAKMSRALNMTAGAYRELGFWAERSGLSTEQWGAAQRALASRLAQAAGGDNEKVASLLRTLNIELRDAAGNARQTDAVLGDLAAAFEANTDPIARQRMAIALFGEEAGVRMVDAMSQGRDAMAALRGEARRLGLSMSQENASAAEKLTDQWTDLSRAGEGLFLTIGARLAPIIGPLIEQLTNWIAANRDLIATNIEGVAKSFAATLEGVDWQAVGTSIAEIGQSIGGVVDMIGGWDNAAIGIAAVLNGPLIASLLNVGIALSRVFLMNPIGAAITAIAAGAYLIYRNWEGVSAWFERMWGNIADIFQGSVDVIAGILTLDFGRAFGGAKQWATGFADLIDGIFDGMIGQIEAVLSLVDDLFSTDFSAGFGRALDGVSSFASSFIPDWLSGGETPDANAVREDGRPGSLGVGRGRGTATDHLRDAAAAGTVGPSAVAAPVTVDVHVAGKVDSLETEVDNGSTKTRDYNMDGALALAGG
ncbi:phage tail tape measure protein [Pacificispira sp.]|uniref:phage tail tape measure protein n=1 Tax=Pacificispira sp. TaxID=2888761 RepID=UPI003BA881CB